MHEPEQQFTAEGPGLQNASSSSEGTSARPQASSSPQHLSVFDFVRQRRIPGDLTPSAPIVGREGLTAAGFSGLGRNDPPTPGLHPASDRGQASAYSAVRVTPRGPSPLGHLRNATLADLHDSQKVTLDIPQQAREQQQLF